MSEEHYKETSNYTKQELYKTLYISLSSFLLMSCVLSLGIVFGSMPLEKYILLMLISLLVTVGSIPYVLRPWNGEE